MSKREQILKTTLELVTEFGLHATPMSLIIKKSDAASGTIYHHFKSKEELIDVLYSELKKEMGNAVILNIDEQLNYKEKFFLILKNLFTFFIENPKKFKFLEYYANSSLAEKEVKEINQGHYQSAIDFLKSGIQVGILREIPIILMINLIFGNISTLVKMILSEEINFSEELLNNVIQSGWDSVKIN